MSAVELAGPSATVADKLPALIAGAGERAIDYFVVNIRHRNTRAAVRVNSQRSPHLRRECRTDDGMGISAVVVSLSAKHACRMNGPASHENKHIRNRLEQHRPASYGSNPKHLPEHPRLPRQREPGENNAKQLGVRCRASKIGFLTPRFTDTVRFV